MLAASQDRRNSQSDHQDSETELDGASELEEEKEEELERHVLAFLISLLDHQLGDDYYKSALVSVTAVLGVDRDRGWKSPLVYTNDNTVGGCYGVEDAGAVQRCASPEEADRRDPGDGRMASRRRRGPGTEPRCPGAGNGH